MTHFVYPRLQYSDTRIRIDEMSAAYKSGGLSELEKFACLEHPKAAPVATGGRVAILSQIAEVRESVLESVSKWRSAESVPRSEGAAFDLAIGRALHQSLSIVPSDAAHDEVWNFLTTVVLPDVAVLRFPDMHPNRMFGTYRNALRRPWIRWEVIGDIVERYDRPLGEDEMVGLFERSAMARNRPLIRALASTVMEYSGSDARSDWARELYKNVRYITGPRALDGFDEEELRDLIREVVRRLSDSQGGRRHQQMRSVWQ